MTMLDRRVDIPETVVFQTVDDELVLLDLDSGVYYGLDRVGARIWRLLAEHGEPRRALEALIAEYEVAPERAAADLVDLVAELEARGLVRTRA